MKAIYRGRKVDVWQVSRDNVQPDWVKDAFEHNGLRWLHGSGNKVRIYWPAVTRAKKGIIRTILNGISASFVGIAGGASAMYDIGFEEMLSILPILRSLQLKSSLRNIG